MCINIRNSIITIKREEALNTLTRIICFTVVSFSSLVSDEIPSLKEMYMEVLAKYNAGTVYIDQDPSGANLKEIESFQAKSPFKQGIPFPIAEADLPSMRNHYLKTIKQAIRGILETDDLSNMNHPHNPHILKEYAYTHVSGEGMDTLLKLMNDVESRDIPGDFVEAGVWRGGLTIFMKAFLNAYQNYERTIWVADSFAGFPEILNDPDTKTCNNQNLPWIVVSLETVKNNFKRLNLLDDRVQFLKGWFKDTLPQSSIEKIAILRVDGDLYDSTKDVLEALYPRLVIGGYVIIDDYDCYAGCNRAIEEYRTAHGITDPVFRQGPVCCGIYWQKTHD